MASVPLADLIQLGHDLFSIKLYSICGISLWFYDYFLTLGDEVHYAWKTENLFMLALYLLVRYLPAPFLVWSIFSQWSPKYTNEICQKTEFIGIMYFAFISAFAQIVLAQRAYAITWKSKWVVGILYTISAVNFSVGLYMSIHAMQVPALMTGIPLDSYHACLPHVDDSLAITQLALAVSFDVAVLVLVVVQTQILKARNRGMGVLTILNAVTRDAVTFFLSVSATHLLVVIMYVAARPMLRLLVSEGNAVLVPIMTTRTIISLKKVASKPQTYLSIRVPSTPVVNVKDGHAHRRTNDIPLSVFKDERC